MEAIANQLAGIESSQEKQPETGELVIISEPAAATVYLDDALIGKAPLKLENIPACEHKLKFLADGDVQKEGKVTVNPGKSNKVQVELEKKKGGKKWIWIGSTTVLAGAGGAVYFFFSLKRKRSPRLKAENCPNRPDVREFRQFDHSAGIPKRRIPLCHQIDFQVA